MKIRFYLLIFIFLFLYIISLSAFNINYQGKLLDNDSRRVNTTADIIFSLYNVATSGTALWQETHNNVSVTNGLFNVELGTITPINLKFDNQYYLGININGAGELMPRIKINAIAYAFRSRYSDTAAYLEDNAGAAGRMTINDTLIISQNVIITDDGKIGVGTLTPSEQIEVTGNIKASGNVNAAAFIGDGAQLTNLGATTLVDGSVRSHHILNETIINDDISQTASISPTKIDTEALRLGDTQILFGLNAQKIGAGNVDNTEFNYLDGVMAPLQTQINALSEDTNGLLARVESLESDSHNTEQRLLVLESDSQNTELRLQDLESDSENTENRLLSLEADSQNTELRLQNLEADSTNAENRFLALESDPVTKSYVDADSIAKSALINTKASSDNPTLTGNITLPSGIWNSSGNVGIGTAAPADSLQIEGSILMIDSGAIKFGNNNVMVLGSSSSNSLIIYTNGVKQFIITSDGKVGIGTETPVHHLDINGSIRSLNTNNRIYSVYAE